MAPNPAVAAAPAPSATITSRAKDAAAVDPESSAAASMLNAGGASRSAPVQIQGPEDEDDKLPGIILAMRLANMVSAGALIAISILVLVGLPSISTWVLSVYATCGGILVCCLETQLKFFRTVIALNFGFLFSPALRFMFYLLLAAISWTYGRIFGEAVSIAVVCVAIFNTYILCRYPAYRKIREKIAEEEDRRIEAKISKQVQQQAIRSFTG